MNEMKNWYAVYTRPGQEKKVAESLNRKKLESYCPVTHTVLQSGYGKKIIQKPLFKSYTFARISENEITHLKQTDGVINLLFWLGKPAVIPDSEIETMKEFLTKYTAVKIQKINMNHALPGSSSMVSENDLFDEKNQTTSAMLSFLGYVMVAEPEAANIQIKVHPVRQKWTHNWVQWEQKLMHVMQINFRN
jgi:transcription antitermination factor NusG